MSEIVEAVCTVSKSRIAALGPRIEKAMADAVKDALASGIPLSDSKAIYERMMAARQAVKDAL